MHLVLESYVFIFGQWSNRIKKADTEDTTGTGMLHFVWVRCEVPALVKKAFNIHFFSTVWK